MGAGFMIFLIFLLQFLVGFSFFTAIAWLMARLLMLIFSFELFEAMILSALISGFTGYVGFRIFISMAEDGPPDDDDDDEINNLIRKGVLSNPGRTMWKPDRNRRSGGRSRSGSSSNARSSQAKARRDNEDSEYDVIPSNQFYKKASERTWEKWLAEEIANDIYTEFQDNPQSVSNLNDTQTQALAVRLADVGLQILKSKNRRVRNLKTTKNAFAQEAAKADQRPDSDEILAATVDAFNLNVDYYNDEILAVIQDKKWGQLATIKGRE